MNKSALSDSYNFFQIHWNLKVLASLKVLWSKNSAVNWTDTKEHRFPPKTRAMNETFLKSDSKQIALWNTGATNRMFENWSELSAYCRFLCALRRGGEQLLLACQPLLETLFGKLPRLRSVIKGSSRTIRFERRVNSFGVKTAIPCRGALANFRCPASEWP